MILLVTNEEDVTCDLVVIRLRARAIPYVRFNTDKFLIDSGFTWSIDGNHVLAELNGRRNTLDLSTVTAVWYRRPVSPRTPSAITHPGAADFATREAEACLRNLWSQLGGLWVSPPAAIRAAEAKLEQLRRAVEVGLPVPATLVTDDPTRARDFCRVHRQIVAKSLGSAAVDHVHGRSVIFTTALHEEDFDQLDAVALVPTLLQERIPKRCDLRVTIVGERVFAAEIHTPYEPDILDWRREPLERLAHTHHELPEKVARQVTALTKGFGLQFAAIDFVVEPSGRYVFLELNPNGQWGWIELSLGVPIADALVDLLTGQEPPL